MIKVITSNRKQDGFTMVELMVTTVALAIILAVVNSVFFTSNDMYSRTNQRADLQMDNRLGMGIMAREIRHAGCDPQEIGITGVVRAAADTIRVRADMDGDGAIQTAEPSEDITYFYNPAQQTIFRDPGTGPQPIVDNVSAMTLTYLDANNNVLGPLPLSAAQANRVRLVSIAMTTTSQDAGDLTLNTTVLLRNP
jgi:prepilin-type N-terminal cleavage/methylation domain-containing protein